MRKRIMIPVFLLFLALIWLGCAAADTKQAQNLRIQMVLSETEVQVGDTVQVMIQAINTTGKDFPEAMTLSDPDGKKVGNFGDPVLKNGETVTWFGTHTVSKKDLQEERISYSFIYAVTDENGELHKKKTNFGLKITPGIPEATPEPEPTPEPKPEDFDDVVLYAVYRPNPSTGYVSVGCVDRGGNVWLAEKADVRWPAADRDVRDMLRTRRGMTKYESLIGTEADGTVLNDAWFFWDVPAMVDAVPQPAERPRKTGIDVGQEAVWGLRKNERGEEESVLLGMAGSYVYENPSPDAQRLYLFMWRMMVLDEIFHSYGVCYATESVSPQGFRGVTVREFYSLADGDLSKARITAAWLDGEDGPEEKELSPEEMETIRTLAERGMIIRKENTWFMPQDVLTYIFTDEQGSELGRIRLFSYAESADEEGELTIRTLAAGEDGMYQTVLMPRPLNTLTEEEIRLMTVRIEGVDYVVGQSTPRDLIDHGWACFPELSGVFIFEDPECNNSIEVRTRGESLDEPIISISCQFAYEADIEYCGYDGILDPDNPDDPDWGYFDEDPAEEPDDGTDETPDEAAAPDPDDEYAWQKQWVALTEWIHDVLGAGQDTSAPGTSVCYPLSDGRYLYLFSNSSPIVITLSEYGPDSDIW